MKTLEDSLSPSLMEPKLLFKPLPAGGSSLMFCGDTALLSGRQMENGRFPIRDWRKVFVRSLPYRTDLP
jgi:hypothetical protein